MSKYSKDCRICRAEQEAEIQQLKERNKNNRRTIQLEQERAQKLKEQVEAAKTQWYNLIMQTEKCNGFCAECERLCDSRLKFDKVFSEGFSAEKSSLTEETTK